MTHTTESERKPTDRDKTILKRPEPSSLLGKAAYSTRIGGHYLFNSLPQPAPSYEAAEGPGTKKDVTQSLGSSPASFPYSRKRRQGTGETSPCRVSVDRHTLHQITQKEVAVRAALVSSATRPFALNNPSAQAKYYSEHQTDSVPADKEDSDAFKSSSSVTFTDKLAPNPIDLACYVRSDDLSASFEASMLQSLKEAAIRGGALDRNLMEEQSSGRSNSETHVGDANEKCADECHLPVPRQKPGNLYLQARNISFSDDESSMVGVVSIADFPPPNELVQTKDVGQLDNCNRHQTLTEFKNRRDTWGMHVYRTDSLEDVSAAISTIADDPCIHVTYFDNSLPDVPPATAPKRTISEPCLQIAPADAQPRVGGESTGEGEASQLPGSEAASPPPLADTDSDEVAHSCERLIDVLYDPILDCYYDPVSGKYYEMD